MALVALVGIVGAPGWMQAGHWLARTGRSAYGSFLAWWQDESEVRCSLEWFHRLDAFLGGIGFAGLARDSFA